MIATPSSPRPVAGPDDVSARLLQFLSAADRAATASELYDALQQALAPLVPHDRFSIGWIDRETRRIELVFQRGVGIDLPLHYVSLPTDTRSLPHDVALRGRTVLHTVPDNHDEFRGDPLWRRFGIREVMAVSVPVDGDPAAVLKLYRTSRGAFTDVETRTTEVFARLLGLALATHLGRRHADDSATASEVTDILDRLAHATSPGALLDHLQRRIVAITDATLFRFHVEDGDVRFVEGRNPHAAVLAWQPVHEAGARAARRIAELLRDGLDPNDVTTLFTEPQAVGDAAVPVCGLNAGHDFLATNATVVSVLRDGGTVLSVMLAAWPEDVTPETAARHAAWMDRLVRPTSPDLARLVRMAALERQVAELDIVRRLIDSVARTRKLRDAFEVICRTSQLVTDFDFVAVGETTSDHLIWHAASGAKSPASFVGQRHPVPPSILDDLLEHRYEIILEDVRKEPDMTPEIMPVHTQEQLRSTVILPVHVNARLRGAMIASQRHLHTFTKAELSLLHQLAGTVATAIAANDARLTGDEND